VEGRIAAEVVERPWKRIFLVVREGRERGGGDLATILEQALGYRCIETAALEGYSVSTFVRAR
jgi:hypothetical protein